MVVEDEKAKSTAVEEIDNKQMAVEGNDKIQIRRWNKKWKSILWFELLHETTDSTDAFGGVLAEEGTWVLILAPEHKGLTFRFELMLTEVRNPAFIGLYC